MIVPMKRMTLFALRDDENRIVKALQEISAVQIIAPQDGEESRTLNEDLFGEYEEKLKTLQEVAGILRPYGRKQGLLTPQLEVDEEKFNSYDTQREADKVCAAVNEIKSETARLSAELAETNNLLSALEPWLGLDTPVEKLCSTKHTKLLYGFLPHERKNDIEASSIAVSYAGKGDAKSVPCIIAFHKSQAEEANALLRECGFVQITFKEGMKGYVRDNMAMLAAKKDKLLESIEAQNEKLKDCGGLRDDLLIAMDAVSTEYMRLKSMADILKSKSSFLLDGWVREDETEKVENAIKSVTDAYYVCFDDPTEEDVPPTAVKNNKVATPFETIVNMYSRPSYKGVDATALIAPTYMLFFGMMLSDTGYGLLLFLGTLLFERFKKPKGTMKGLVGVIKYSGLVTVICGVLFGSFFGVDFDVIFGTKDVFPLVLDPINDVMSMLILCCGMGIAHMIFGLCVKIKMCLKEGDVQGALYDNVSWILVLVGIVGSVAFPSPYSMPFIIFAVIGVMLIIVFGGRKKKGIMRILGGFGALYSITNYLSDTVSYARIFAIGLVGGAMGQVFNMIGAMIASGSSGVMHIILLVAAALILVALHAFSLFINTLSAFAHTARLEYVEFFGKFYESGGREFKPLSMDTRNVTVQFSRQTDKA